MCMYASSDGVSADTVTSQTLSQGNKHKQISDRLRDAQSKRWILKAEVDLINQNRDTRIAEINALQLQFEVHPSCQSFCI